MLSVSIRFQGSLFKLGFPTLVLLKVWPTDQQQLVGGLVRNAEFQATP